MTHPREPHRQTYPWRRAFLAVGLALAIGPAQAALTPSDPIRFRVYLGQEPIGEHSFQFSPARGQDGHAVVSRAAFDVKLFFINAYRYRHESREEWRDGCLMQIRASTDDNGKAYRVEGEREPQALSLKVNGDAKDLPRCVSTFAYWDRDFLKQRRLLNPQTGELMDVRVVPMGTERRVFRGREVQAEGYRLQAEQVDIVLWYTKDGRWIGLESDTGKGRTLRYEPI